MAEAGGDQGTYRVTEDVPQRYYDIEQIRMTLEAGWLGKIFGSATNAPTNIAGIVLSASIISIFLVLLIPTRMETIEYLKLVLPVVTLVLGYLFGKST
jgi:hypothetical protein